MLSNADINTLITFRRQLHQYPEISGEEEQTAEKIAEALSALNPSQIITGLGGHGVAGVFDTGETGPTVLFRAELDALPIPEETGLEWSSLIEGKGHLCGHDGHMTILLALGRLILRKPLKKGRVVLMFQPAEEDGSGAKMVVEDPKFSTIAPDYAFAIHNEPGLPFGFVGTKKGLINCASRGLIIRLKGKTSHAAEPELAKSPVPVLGEIINHLCQLGQGGDLDDDFRLVTVTHINVGEPSFGITPSDAEIYTTLRSSNDPAIVDMQDQAIAMAQTKADEKGLALEWDIQDDFAASINHPLATNIAEDAMASLNIPFGADGVPMRASEDFGVFGWDAPSAMLCLGSGVDHPALHQPDYDFPDDLIPIGAAIFEKIARDILG